MTIPFLDALEITSPQEVATIATPEGNIGLYVSAGNPNGDLDASIGSICFAKTGTVWRKATSDGTSTGWLNVSPPNAPTGLTYMVTVDDNGVLGSQAIPTGGVGGMDTVATKSQLGDASTAPKPFRRIETSKIVYASVNDAWEIHSNAAIGTAADKADLELTPGELEVGYELSVGNDVYVWDGTKFVLQT